MSNAKVAITGVFLVLIILIGIGGLAFYGNSLDYAINRIFSPLNAQVQYDTFKNSQAYNEGVIGDLMGIMDQYNETKDPAAKQSLRTTFIYKKQHYPNPLPPELQAFYDQLTSQ
jgi:hypothetical protein